MMIARLEEVVWDLTRDEGVLSEKREGVVACAIIVLHSASSGRGCEKPASDCSNFRFYGALLCLLQSLDSMSAPPPSLLFEFDGALTSFETYQVTGFNSPLNSDSHSSKPVVIITELERDGRISFPTIAAISADLTLSGGNLIWGRSWHGLGEDVQVAIFRGGGSG